MAMLAEPRRKIRYTVNPSGANWRQDQGGGGGGSNEASASQFGQRMMLSMGWREGQGLGKDAQGNPEPIRVKRKSDQRGVGCTSAYAAETMPQNDDFASLLARLNAEHATDASGAATESVNSVVGLEAKSKASRARLHYHRFTRGKDVSAYDAKSLACIFGQAPTGLKHSSSDGCLQKQKQEDDEEKPVEVTAEKKPDQPAQESQSHHGMQLVQSQTSLEDYFKAKMQQIKLRRLATVAAAAAEEGSWTSESSCSAASTLSEGASPETGRTAAAAEESDESVTINFGLFPGSEFQRVLGYPLY